MSRLVTLRHPDLDNAETRQPESTAKVLEASGWQRVDDDEEESSAPQPRAAASQPRPVERPNVNATKSQWVRYAEAQGGDVPDDVTKEQLIEQYGKDN